MGMEEQSSCHEISSSDYSVGQAEGKQIRLYCERSGYTATSEALGRRESEESPC